MKKTAFFSLLSLGLLLSCSDAGDNTSPEASTVAFLSHLQKQEYLKAQRYASAASAEILEDQARGRPSFELTQCQSVNETTQICIIKFCQVFDEGKQCEQDTFTLLYEAKTWRVDWKGKIESQFGSQEQALREQLEQIEELKKMQQAFGDPDSVSAN